MRTYKRKTRQKLWQEYDDTVKWEGHTLDDLLVCLGALQTELLMDVREQNDEIIRLLQSKQSKPK